LTNTRSKFEVFLSSTVSSLLLVPVWQIKSLSRVHPTRARQLSRCPSRRPSRRPTRKTFGRYVAPVRPVCVCVCVCDRYVRVPTRPKSLALKKKKKPTKFYVLHHDNTFFGRVRKFRSNVKWNRAVSFRNVHLFVERFRFLREICSSILFSRNGRENHFFFPQFTFFMSVMTKKVFPRTCLR
jgi:hypothetical protein